MENSFDIYDLDDIRASVAANIDDFVLTLFPTAKKKGAQYRVGDVDGDTGRSTLIATHGGFRDFATGESGSCIQLVSITQGLTIKEAIRWIAKRYNISSIQGFKKPKVSDQHEDLQKKLRPLTERAIEYAENVRDLSKETLEAYGVCSGSHGELIFPHYDNHGKLGLLKHWEASDAKKMWTNENCIHTLFGKDICDPDRIGSDRIIITEGQWDALSLHQLGLSAVSIPSGVTNFEWIDEDYYFLSHFIEIILIFDNDPSGMSAAKEAASRLGPSRCVIVNLPTSVKPIDGSEGIIPIKDPNDVLKSGHVDLIPKLIETTLKQPLAEIVGADEMKNDTVSYLRGEHLTQGSPFFLPNFKLHFRPHEITLWFGYSTHGKSTILQNQIAYEAGQGNPSVVASFEQQPARTLGAILQAMMARKNLVDDADFDKAYDYINQMIFIYRSRERADPKHLIDTFTHAHRRHGVKNFVIDNVMTLDIDRGDNTAQANAMDLIRNFAANNPVHTHIVAHPRKSPDNTIQPPQMSEIRGASEWGDMPDNILAMWRDTKKSELIAERQAGGQALAEIKEYWNAIPCAKITCRKQRLTGEHPVAKMWHHKGPKRFTLTPEAPGPMFESLPWE